MRDFTRMLRKIAEPMWRQEEEALEALPDDPDDETFHVQADGFYGPEKGFHDAEQLRKQR
jgi:hypothetical protein